LPEDVGSNPAVVAQRFVYVELCARVVERERRLGFGWGDVGATPTTGLTEFNSNFVYYSITNQKER